MKAASIVINSAIFCVTLILMTMNFWKDGRWQPGRGLSAFRYFTVLSNCFCAIVALMMAIAQIRGEVPVAVLMLKYMGTASVAVTFMTVMAFLGPTQGYRTQLTGSNLYMHLIGPLLAVASFCFMEKGAMPPAAFWLGLIPVALYGAVYIYKILLAPPDGRWEDFYGFNRGGRWPLALSGMLAGTAAVCLVLWLI